MILCPTLPNPIVILNIKKNCQKLCFLYFFRKFGGLCDLWRHKSWLAHIFKAFVSMSHFCSPSRSTTGSGVPGGQKRPVGGFGFFLNSVLWISRPFLVRFGISKDEKIENNTARRLANKQLLLAKLTTCGNNFWFKNSLFKHFKANISVIW